MIMVIHSVIVTVIHWDCWMLQQRFVAVNPLEYAPKVTSKPVEEGTSSLGEEICFIAFTTV